MVKQIVADALPKAILNDEEARGQFRAFVERRLKGPDGSSLLAGTIAADDSRAHAVSVLVADLRSGSLQSVDELSRAASFSSRFRRQRSSVTYYRLRAAFRVRNQIAHEMDVDFSTAPSIRRARGFDEMVQHTNAILEACSQMISAVDARLLAG